MNKTTEALKRVLSYVEQTAQFIPHDLDDEGIAVAALLREALAEPVKQEPVAWMDFHKELGQLRWMGGDEGWDNAIHAVRKRLEELYAAPVDAKAIRAEALEEAAKLREKFFDKESDEESDWNQAIDRYAAAIRGLK